MRKERKLYCELYQSRIGQLQPMQAGMPNEPPILWQPSKAVIPFL